MHGPDRSKGTKQVVAQPKTRPLPKDLIKKSAGSAATVETILKVIEATDKANPPASDKAKSK